MKNKNIENIILRLLLEIRPEYDFSNSTDFIKDGMLDSFDIVQLVAALDDEFGISIDGMDIKPENCTSINTIYELLIKKGITI